MFQHKTPPKPGPHFFVGRKWQPHMDLVPRKGEKVVARGSGKGGVPHAGRAGFKFGSVWSSVIGLPKPENTDEAPAAIAIQKLGRTFLGQPTFWEF